MDEECLQPTNPLEEIYEIVQKIEGPETVSHLPKDKIVQPSEILFPDERNGLWTMEFDGASGREGVGLGVWIHV